jgi:hypothetical protein
MARSATTILGVPGGHDDPPLEMLPTRERANNKSEQTAVAPRGLLRKGCTKLETSEQFAKACGARRSIERISCTEWDSEMIVGYSRVSTDGRTLYAQQAALRDTPDALCTVT